MRFPAALLLFAAPVFANGILVGGKTTPATPVRLTQHHVQARITDRAAHVTVRQTFFNTTPRVLEGTYLFPLPRGATVSGFAMTMGGKMVRGEILDSEKARKIYISIVRRRRDPGLLEYCGRNLYRARVFPIPARGRIEIELSYDQLLPEEGGALEFQYPLATERLNRAPVEQIVVEVDYAGSSALTSIYSPSHRIDVIRKGDREARVTYERSRVRPARNLQIYFARTRRDLGMAVLSHRVAGEPGTFLAMVGFDAGIKPEKLLAREMIYVLDTSGSMGGEKMEQAKAALAEAVGMLRPQDSFSMIGFATEARSFRRKLVPATEQNKVEARRWIRAREAAGGTAMDDALETALKMAVGGKLPIIVLLTDGRPTVGRRDAEGIVNHIKSINSGRARVFTFGIGADLDVVLLDRIAEATRGRRDYVSPHESIGTVTRRFFRRIDQPIARDVVFEPSEGIHGVYPRRIGDLFAADQIVLLGRYEQSGAARFTLRGVRGDEPFSRTYDVALSDHAGNESLPRIWAQRKVAFLWDQMRLHGGSSELKDEIRRLGTKYAILTPFTSGLVLEDHRDGPLFFTSKSGKRRRTRVYGVGTVPPGLRAPSGPATTSPPSGGATTNATIVSTGLRALKEEARMHDAGDRTLAAGKTFRWDHERGWVDAAWDGKGKPTEVFAFSDAYFKLIELDPKIARYLAMGEWVTFVHRGEAYAVKPK